MNNLESVSHSEIFAVIGAMQRQFAECPCFEAVAQRCMDLFYERFAEDLVLVRTYVTTPYQSLPAPNRQFVDRLARTKDLILKPNVPVLSLVGTRGNKSGWNDRRKSVGHVGIPLVSVDFIGALPMIARMLADFEVDLHWLEKPERDISTTRSGWAGIFHVLDARQTRDQHQRLIIPAQDFVAEEEVRTVFGVGGSYPSGTLFAMIFFTRRTFNRELAQRFLPITSMFKNATSAHVEAGRIFAD
jgi:hypothetical protein